MRFIELKVREAWDNRNIFCLHLVARFLFTLENPHSFFTVITGSGYHKVQGGGFLIAGTFLYLDFCHTFNSSILN